MSTKNNSSVFEADFPSSVVLLSFFKQLTDRVVAEATNRQKDMTANQLELLVILGQPITMKRVAELLVMKPSNLSTLVDSCVKRGWVERITSDVDKRSVSVKLTPGGRKRRRKIVIELPEIIQSLSGLTEEVADEVVEKLSKLDNAGTLST